MFEFKTKTKQLAIALTVVGAILWVVGFALNGSSSHDAGHGHDAHATEMHADAGHDAHAEAGHDDHGHEAHAEEAHVDHGHDAHNEEAHGDHDAHAEHAAHQIANRPWSALYVAAFFLFGSRFGTIVLLRYSICSTGRMVCWSFEINGGAIFCYCSTINCNRANHFPWIWACTPHVPLDG